MVFLSGRPYMERKKMISNNDKIEIATALATIIILITIVSGTLLSSALGEMTILLIEEYEDESKTIYNYTGNIDRLLDSNTNTNWQDISSIKAMEILNDKTDIISLNFSFEIWEN